MSKNSKDLSPAQREFQRLMAEAGWSQAETARRIDMTRAAVNLILGGKNNPTTALERLRSAVGGVRKTESRDLVTSKKNSELNRPQVVQEHDSGNIPNEEWCLNYFRTFLARAGGKPEHLGWIKTMLKKHFPLSYWDD